MFAKGASSGADLVFLDLEDATPVSLKVESRAKAIKALNELDWGTPPAPSGSTDWTRRGATTI